MILLIAGCVAAGVVAANILLRALVGSYGQCGFSTPTALVSLAAWAEFDDSEWILGLPEFGYSGTAFGYREVSVVAHLLCIHVGASLSSSPPAGVLKERLLGQIGEDD